MANARYSVSDVGAWSRSEWTAQFHSSLAAGTSGKVKADCQPEFSCSESSWKKCAVTNL